MRIGLIAPPWLPVPPPAYGGTESVVDRLARGLVRAGHDVLLAAAANSSCPVPRVAGTAEAA
ncbi:MAG TPA: glycosyltransferase family 4 protein, partial [Blastococcus sp.]